MMCVIKQFNGSTILASTVEFEKSVQLNFGELERTLQTASEIINFDYYELLSLALPRARLTSFREIKQLRCDRGRGAQSWLEQMEISVAQFSDGMIIHQSVNVLLLGSSSELQSFKLIARRS